MKKYDSKKSIWNLRRKYPAEADSLFGVDPFFNEWFYQNNPYCLPLDRLKEMCDEAFADILKCTIKWKDWRDNILVRVICDDKFMYLRFGSFFFVDDCMYMLSKDEALKPYNNDSILGLKISLLMESLYKPVRYVVRVVFAGIYTGLNDENNERIFTGDVVNAQILSCPDTVASVGLDRAKYGGVSGKSVGSSVKGVVMTMTNEANSANGILLDNHFGLLEWSSWIKRIGSIYFDLSPGDTEIEINEMAACFVRGDRVMYKKAALSPYYLDV